MAFDTPRDAQPTRVDLLVTVSAGIAFAAGIADIDTRLSAAGFVLVLAGAAARRFSRWGRLCSFVIGTFLCLLTVMESELTGPGNARHFVALLGGVGILAIAARAPRTRRRDRVPNLSRLSLVVLHDRPRHLESTLLAAIVAEAWQITLPAEALAELPPAEDGAVSYQIQVPGSRFFVRTSAEPYWENPDEVAAHFADLRAQRAIRSHGRWTAIEVVTVSHEPTRRTAFARAGRLAAELAQPAGPLALLEAESGAFRTWDDAIEAGLRENDPLECLTGPGATAVVALDSDDPLLCAAVKEARCRWPEFVSVFSRRHPEQHFSVKAPVSRGGQTEHIWIEVTALAGQTVRGRLGNSPIDLPGLRLGDPIAIPTDTVEDWLYVLSTRPVGGFSIPVVERAQRRAAMAAQAAAR